MTDGLRPGKKIDYWGLIIVLRGSSIHVSFRESDLVHKIDMYSGEDVC